MGYWKSFRFAPAAVIAAQCDSCAESQRLGKGWQAKHRRECSTDFPLTCQNADDDVLYEVLGTERLKAPRLQRPLEKHCELKGV